MPTSIHRIRLLGPWHYEWLDDAPHLEPPSSSDGSPLLSDSRLRMPCSIQQAFGNARGRVRFSRRFQRPTNLEASERVWLAFEEVGGAATISLNEQLVVRFDAERRTFALDVTSHLAQSNLLMVEIDWPGGADSKLPGGLAQPVVIEIRDGDDGSPRSDSPS